MKKAGFSLVELLIAGSILVVLVMGTSQYLLGGLKAQKHVQNAVDFDLLKTSLNLVLNTKACNGAFSSPTGSSIQFNLPAGTTWATLNSSPPVNIVPAGTPIPIGQIKLGTQIVASSIPPYDDLGGGLKISKLEIPDAIYDGEQVVIDPVTSLPFTYKAFAASVLVQATKQAGSTGPPVLSKTVAVRFLINPSATNSGMVEKCSQPSTTYQGVCYALRREESVTSPHTGFIRANGTVVSTLDGHSFSQVAVLKGGSGAAVTSGITGNPLTSSTGGPSAEGDWFGIECNSAQGWIMMGCTHASHPNDNDLIMSQNGCFGGVNDGDSGRNIVDIRCCR